MQYIPLSSGTNLKWSLASITFPKLNNIFHFCFQEVEQETLKIGILQSVL